MQYRALARILSSPQIPDSIDASDLLSPYDGKPLQYKYRNRQIVLSVSWPTDDTGEPVRLKIPSDGVLKVMNRQKS